MNELKWCIDYLKEYNHISRELPIDWSTFRALLNITMPLKGDAMCIIFFVSNWLRGFNPRVCPVFIRGLKSNPI